MIFSRIQIPKRRKFTTIGIRFSPKEGLNNPVWVEMDGIYAVLMGRKQDKNEGHIDVLNIGDTKFGYAQIVVYPL